MGTYSSVLTTARQDTFNVLEAFGKKVGVEGFTDFILDEVSVSDQSIVLKIGVRDELFDILVSNPSSLTAPFSACYDELVNVTVQQLSIIPSNEDKGYNFMKLTITKRDNYEEDNDFYKKHFNGGTKMEQGTQNENGKSAVLEQAKDKLVEAKDKILKIVDGKTVAAIQAGTVVASGAKKLIDSAAKSEFIGSMDVEKVKKIAKKKSVIATAITLVVATIVAVVAIGRLGNKAEEE